MLAVFTLLLGAGPSLAHPAVAMPATKTMTMAVASASESSRPTWSPLRPPPVGEVRSGELPAGALVLERCTSCPDTEAPPSDADRRRDKKRRWMVLGGAAAVSAGGVLFMLSRPAPGTEPVRFGVRWSLRGASAAVVGNF